MNNKRPMLVTVICILGFIGVPIQILVSLFAIIFPGLFFVVNFPLWYLILSIFFSLLFFVILIFLWKMKKWALISHTVLSVISYIIMFSIGVGNYFSLIVSVVVVGLLWTQFNKMS